MVFAFFNKHYTDHNDAAETGENGSKGGTNSGKITKQNVILFMSIFDRP